MGKTHSMNRISFGVATAIVVQEISLMFDATFYGPVEC